MVIIGLVIVEVVVKVNKVVCNLVSRVMVWVRGVELCVGGVIMVLVKRW